MERRGRNEYLTATNMSGRGYSRGHSCGIARSKGVEKVSVIRSCRGSSRIAFFHAKRVRTVMSVFGSKTPAGHKEGGSGRSASASPHGNDFSCSRIGVVRAGIEFLNVGYESVPIFRRKNASARYRRSHVSRKGRVENVSSDESAHG